jgi:DNA-binding response OmpR family regulator
VKEAVLVVEDDVAIRRGVAGALRYAGFEPVEAGDGVSGLKIALERPVRLVLLDLALPLRDGLAVLADLRAARPALPVILITARGGEDDRVRGLRLGADDYVVKPFSVRELLARVDAVLRRSPERATESGVLALPACTVDLGAEEVRFDDGGREALTALEARLLRFLAGAGRRFVSRDELLVHVWQADPRRVQTRAVDMAIARLRRKLRDDGRPPRAVIAVRGRGYRLEGACAAPG